MNRAWLVAVVAGFGALAGCTDDLDEQWQLDHTRIIAVRATPPAIASGETSTLDGALGTKGAQVSYAGPDLVQVESPTSLADTLAFTGGKWTITAPSEDRLAAARTELKLAAGAPVPLVLGVAYNGMTLLGTKTVYLGVHADNPTLTNVMIDGQPAPAMDSQVTIHTIGHTPLSIEADDTKFDVEWLTSCGTMHDFDLPTAYVKVEDDDPTTGQLGVVLRDSQGGVAWEFWSAIAQ